MEDLVLVPPEPAPVEAPLAGTWARLAAFLIDIVVLRLIGSAIGAIAGDQLYRLGFWGRPFGFLVALAYLAPMTSALGGGRTLGKRVLGIAVVDSSGAPLSFPRALGREALLWSCYFLNGAVIPPPFDSLVGSVLIGSFALFVIWPILYLAIFNRRTHQSLHDLVFGSYVVARRAVGAPVNAPVIWPAHLKLVVASLLAFMALGAAMSIKFWNNSKFQSMFAAREKLEASGRWVVPTIMTSKLWGAQWTHWIHWQGISSWSYVYVNVFFRDKPTTLEKDSNSIAKILLDTLTPQTLDVDSLIIGTSYGWDIGIASNLMGATWNHSVLEWRSLLSQAAAPTAPGQPTQAGFLGSVPVLPSPQMTPH